MGAAANCTMTPNVSMARIALCSVAYFVAYVVGAYGADWHVSGYGDLTYRTKLLQCAAEAALFLLPSVGLLIWACGRCERAALERLRDLNLFVEYAGALGAGAVIGALASASFVVAGIWFPPARNQAFALAAAGAALMLFIVGAQSRAEAVFRVMEAAAWATTAGLFSWILFYR